MIARLGNVHSHLRGHIDGQSVTMVCLKNSAEVPIFLLKNA